MSRESTKGRKSRKKQNTPKDILLRCIRSYEFNWLHIPLAIFLILFIWIVTYTPEETAPKPKENGIETFRGYDPNRDITEISHIDYTNRAIEYRPQDNSGASSEKRRGRASATDASSSGTTLYDNNGKPLHIDASPEDILEQLRDNIDFDDLADYYDYYPDDEW